jgi:outer membrane protein OmpA-like peptidoglycan-associated protein
VKASGEGLIDERPQITNPRLHVIDQYETWVKLSDVYVASGGEEYLTVGNFLPDQAITRLMRTELEGGSSTSGWAYIYIDKIEVNPIKSKEECSCLNEKIAAEVHDPPLQLSDYEEIRLDAIHFAFDESLLSAESRDLLDDAAALLRRNKYMFLQVDGHADVIGGEEYNVELSSERAQTVINYLVDQGIDPVRLEIAYFGSAVPVADNTTPEGRAQNRRVEFKVLERKFVRLN